MSRIMFYGTTDTGCVRQENQDAILINGIIERDTVAMELSSEGLFYKHYGLLCAVADGIGGQEGGAMASHLVLRDLAAELFQLSSCATSEEAERYLEELVQRMHQSVIHQGKMNPHLAKMGTTLTGIYLRPNYGIYFHAGDSRLYRFRGDFLIQLTNDHVLENINDSPGENVLEGSKSGIITSSIGGGPSARCLLDTSEVLMEADDILMLCSDGLSNMVPLEKMEEIIADNNDNLENAVESLITAAKNAGGYDNISVILMKKRSIEPKY